jgi:hypothetical protein
MADFLTDALALYGCCAHVAFGAGDPGEFVLDVCSWTGREPLAAVLWAVQDVLGEDLPVWAIVTVLVNRAREPSVDAAGGEAVAAAMTAPAGAHGRLGP